MDKELITKSIIHHLRTFKIYVKKDEETVVTADNKIDLVNKHWVITVEVLPLTTNIVVISQHTLKTLKNKVPKEFRTTKNVAEAIGSCMETHKNLRQFMR